MWYKIKHFTLKKKNLIVEQLNSKIDFLSLIIKGKSC